MSERGGQFDRFGWALGLLAGLGFLVAGAIWVGNFIEDDALISLRYAERFLEGKGLTWNDGERVEGYSNLAWILACAALGALGLDLIVAARLLAFSCWAVTFGALLMLARRVGATWPTFSAASIALGATASLSVWAMGALEQPMVVACLAVALWALCELALAEEPSRSWAWRAAAALCVLVWTRPDSPLLVAVFGAGALALLARRIGPRAALSLSALVVVPPFIAWSAQLAFRLAYYGEWVPNPAHIKTHLSVVRVAGGLRYVALGLGVAWLLTGVGVAGAVLAFVRRETRGLGFAVLALVVAWTAYVIIVGGDHFPAFRHLLVAQLCFAVLLILGLGRWQAGRRAPLVALALVGLLVIPYVQSQRRYGDINVAPRARWQWDGEAVGKTFGSAFASERPLWAVTAAGCLPYFSRLPALDLLGLSDAHIARQPPDLSLPLAHDHGDGAYVLERAPDLVTFGLPRGQRPMYKSGREMNRDPRFRADYQRVTFRTLEPISVLSDTYVRRTGAVGFSHDEDRLVVPAYLLRGAIGHPLPDGNLGARLPPRKRVTVDLPELPAGRYEVRVVPHYSDLDVRIVALRGKRLRAEDEPGSFSTEGPALLRLEARAPRATTLLGSIVIERVGLPREATATATKVVVVQSSAPHPAEPSHRSLGDWTEVGEAPGDQPIDARARGRRISPSFLVKEGSWLEFQIAGTQAYDYHTQVGVRLIDHSTDPPVPRFFFTGRDDDTLRPIRVDLTPFVGRELHIEVLDDSAFARVVATDFKLYER